uniref:Uncharacterized protein n=1 Tax=Amphimedon queenslandica TaxID=400682 RepID=A0A1X7TQ15_AMPQE
MPSSPSSQDQNPDEDREPDVAQEPSGYALPMGMGSQYGDGPHGVSTPLEGSVGKRTWRHPGIRIPPRARTTQSSLRPGGSAGNRHEPQDGYRQTKH